MKLTRSGFLALTEEKVEDWYSTICDTLGAIKIHLDEELSGFETQSGVNRLAFYKTRAKELESIWDKITAYKTSNIQKLDSELKRMKVSESGTFNLQDLLGDLVGGRLVFYFQPDLKWGLTYFITFPLFQIEDIELYESLGSPESVLTSDNNESIEYLAKNLHSNAKSKKKKSGYESIHMRVRIKPDILAAKCKKDPSACQRSNADSYQNTMLMDFPVEIQLRTIFQHTWAQVEHNLNYALKKSQGASHSRDPFIQNDFHAYKLLLQTAEQHQNLIWLRHWKKPLYIELSKTSSDYGRRLASFDSAEQSEITRIHGTIINSEDRRQYKAIDEFLSLSNRFSDKYRENFFSPEIPSSADAWKRKRAILLTIGYLSIIGNNNVHRKINKHIASFAYSPTPDIEINTISLFEQIKAADTIFRYAHSTVDSDLFFCDPLVNYRAAGLHFVNGSIRRAIELMQDAIANRQDLLGHHNGTDVQSDPIINILHFTRRRAEYFWRLYHSESRENINNLVEALNLIRAAATEKDVPSDPEKLLDEKRKILAHRIIMLFYLYIDINRTLPFEIFKYELDSLSDEIDRYLPFEFIYNSGKGVLNLQALSIFNWRKGESSSAIKCIEKALINASEADNPFYISIAEEINEILNTPFRKRK